jgi:hypothetical protein
VVTLDEGHLHYCGFFADPGDANDNESRLIVATKKYSVDYQEIPKRRNLRLEDCEHNS